MADDYGVPARQLDDAELERQGVRAHATRHWVFLHGTAEQFQTHTKRMLELEQEYLRRHPQRTWQGSGGAAGGDRQAEAVARDARIRDLVRTLSEEVLSLLDDNSDSSADHVVGTSPVDAQVRLLAAFADSPNGSMHKLEAHQVARKLAPNARLVAELYKHDPAFLLAVGDQRSITEAGREWLSTQLVQ